LLRLLLDAREVEGAYQGQVPEGEMDVAHPDPRPRDAQRADEQYEIDHPQPQQGAAGHATREARGPEGGVVPEVAALERHVPDPAQAERRQGQQDRHQEGPEELTPAPVEVELLAAEVRVRDHERLTRHEEERVVEAQGEAGQEAAEDEDLDEGPHVPAEREANAPPRGAAQP